MEIRALLPIKIMGIGAIVVEVVDMYRKENACQTVVEV
jgi:hypothetical protein